ncbi:hypothetical protein HDU83_003170 [Entophlyctis luteolus]|nr:hypothetical protein HDU83_003170 [Entophlyctis luteolus]
MARTSIPTFSPPSRPDHDASTQAVQSPAEAAAILALATAVPSMAAATVASAAGVAGPLADTETAALCAWAGRSDAARRYLVDTRWDAPAAQAKLRATMEWRLSFGTHRLRADDVAPLARKGAIFINGFDACARPVLHIRALQLGAIANATANATATSTTTTTTTAPHSDLAPVAVVLRSLIWYVETVLRILPKGVSKMCVCIDIEGLGFSNSPPASIATGLLNVFQNHYPEQLGVLCVINPSLFLYGLYKLLRPLMNEVTVAKLRFMTLKKNQGGGALEESDRIASPELLDVISASVLPSFYGGEFFFDEAVYWAHLTDFLSQLEARGTVEAEE